MWYVPGWGDVQAKKGKPVFSRYLVMTTYNRSKNEFYLLVYKKHVNFSYEAWHSTEQDYNYVKPKCLEISKSSPEIGQFKQENSYIAH